MTNLTWLYALLLTYGLTLAYGLYFASMMVADLPPPVACEFGGYQSEFALVYEG